MRNRQQNKGATFEGLNVLPKPDFQSIIGCINKPDGSEINTDQACLFCTLYPIETLSLWLIVSDKHFVNLSWYPNESSKTSLKLEKKWKSRELFKTGKRGDFKAETLLLIRRRIFQREKISKKASRSIRVEDGEDAWGFQSNRKLRSLWRLRRDESRRLLCT